MERLEAVGSRLRTIRRSDEEEEEDGRGLRELNV
jgi:hypothetical protein